MKIYCLSIYNENYNLFKKLGLLPVGLGKNKFTNKWLNDKSGKNIYKKNKNFGEYTFHYNYWKNFLKKEKKNEWIGFCTYRRFWIKNTNKSPKKISDLNKIVIKSPLNNWKNYDVILTSPIKINKIKNMKLIKRNFLEVLKKPSVLVKKNTLEEHFNIFHGSYFLKESIKILSKKDQIGFSKYLNKHKLNAYNMFICKNKKILDHYYKTIFPWLFKCEKKFKNKKLKGYDKVRIYGFLAERFMPYWFKSRYEVYENKICYFDTHLVR